MDQDQGRTSDSADAVTAPVGAVGVVGTDATTGADAAEEAAFERAMELGRQVMSDHHAVLAALAK